ncbi:hypothetical protein [Aquimonas voraii]|uniref:Right handed beta helix region n=1 Tax=Aquimonas voraii TaxID=265719 RepID=A0A1G6VJM6_9GAMM|nr:hypothetical protein [Aquimonas voraii]SDD53830.1 hypothetical protein SAMN04488509_103124 [Aquimonas voraii]
MPASRIAAAPCLLIALGLSAPSEAATYRVGVGVGCTHASIQSALDAAAASAENDVVLITRSGNWTEQALTLSVTNQTIDIRGGYAACADATPDGVRTPISGAGGAQASVLRVGTSGTNSSVSLSDLTLSGGDATGTSTAGNGGGLQFSGAGQLQLLRTVLSGNSATRGGGLHVAGINGAARIVLGAGSQIIGNTASSDGGGIYLDQASLEMHAADSLLFNNRAEGSDGRGYGGGLLIRAGMSSASASLRGAGANGLAKVQGNRARYGGGVAVLAEVGSAETALLEAASSQRSAFQANSADVAGGAIYLKPYDGTQNSLAIARLANVRLYDNIAPDGAAIYIDTDIASGSPGAGAEVEIDHGTLASVCPVGDHCSLIEGNAALNAASLPSSGALVRVRELGSLRVAGGAPNTIDRGGPWIRDNDVGPLFRGDECLLSLNNALITGNIVSTHVVSGNCPQFELGDLTIAGNTISGSAIFNLQGAASLRRSVLWQPGKLSMQGTATRDVVDVVTQESASIDTGFLAFVTQANPRFVDPARDDYRLRAGSPAVDYAPATGSADRDARGQPRDVDLPIRTNFPRGPRDLGALERQSLAPLLLFGDFDVAGDLGLWPETTAGASVWSDAQNASGSAGSGALQASLGNIPQARVTVRQQCVHLPGPGRYALNGWGRSVGATISTRDSVLLHWQLRHNGGENCTQGNADVSGDHFLTSSASWTQPATPADIQLPDVAWTPNSSLTVSLVVVDVGVTSPAAINGWFDGISLAVSPLGDALFGDGFE